MEGGEMVSPESALTLAISEPLERGGGEEGRRGVGGGGGKGGRGEEGRRGVSRGRTGGIKESMLREV